MTTTLTAAKLADDANLHLGNGGLPVVRPFEIEEADTWYPVRLPAGFIGLRPRTNQARFSFNKPSDSNLLNEGGGLIADVWHEYRSPVPHTLYVSSQTDETVLEITASPGGPLEVCAARALELLERIEQVSRRWERG